MRQAFGEAYAALGYSAKVPAPSFRYGRVDL